MTSMSMIAELWSRCGCQCSLRHGAGLGNRACNGNRIAGSARGDRTSCGLTGSGRTGGLCAGCCCTSSRRTSSCGSAFSGIQSWTRNDISAEGVPNVNVDARVGILVRCGADGTTRLCSTAASHLEIDALRIVLSTIRIVSTMKSNDFMSQNIISRRNIAGNGDGAIVAIFDEQIGILASRNRRIIDQSAGIDLEELQSGLIHVKAVAVAICHVCDDRTVVVIRPCASGQLDRTAWGDWGREDCRHRATMVDDTGIVVCSGREKIEGCLVVDLANPGLETR